MIRYRHVAVLLVLLPGAGCYTLQPVSGGVAPAVGSRVEVEVNDAGRVALGGSMGNEIDRIDGMLLEKDTAGMTLSVKHVYGLRGSVQVWSDEMVRIEDSYVRTMASRRFSTARSVAFGAAGVGGFTLLFTSGIIALAPPDQPPPTDTLGQQILRVVRP